MSYDFRSRERFSDRVTNYAQFRPGYPVEVMEIIQREFGLAAGATVADIGSGTGIFSQMLLDRGHRVFGVEPNQAMRQAAEDRFRSNPQFTSFSGTAEETGLPDHSVQLVTAAQAFHWFDAERCRTEFARILTSPGNVLLIWNERKRTGTPFQDDYECFLQDYGTDFQQMTEQSQKKIAGLKEFFLPGTYRNFVLDQAQFLTLPEFTGRILSSSFIPGEQHPRHTDVLRAIPVLFEQHAESGRIRLEYDVLIFLGQVS